MPDAYSIGTQADSVVAAGANGTVIALLKRLTLQLDTGGSGNQIEGTTASGGAATSIRPVLLGHFRVSDNTLNRWTSGVPADALTNSGVYPYTQALVSLFNGTSWDRQRSPGLGTSAIGRFRTTFKNTPTVGTGTAYAAGDVVGGGSNQLTSAARISGGSGIIRAVTVINRNGIADIAIALRVWYFDSSPSSSTFTDNAALNINDTDISRLIGFVDLPGSGGAATSNEAWTKECALPFVASGTANIFCVLESRGALAANVGTTDWTIITQVEHD